MVRPLNRRSFLRHAAAGAGGLVLLRDSRSASGTPANSKLNVGIVGVSGRGEWFVDTIAKLENVGALCDVDLQRAGKAFAAIPQARRFRDFRTMLNDMGAQIDAVIVATPDHTHAVATAAAIRAGKHVYTEKPLSRIVGESRVLRELATKSRVATSMGTQGTASGQFRRALELIRGGAIGRIEEVHAWNDQGGAAHDRPPQGDQSVPPYLQWDLWLGPAQSRPFHADWLAWHGWRDFGTGHLGNWASHTLNLAFMALSVDALWHTGSVGRGSPDPAKPGAAVGRPQPNGGAVPAHEAAGTTPLVIRVEAKAAAVNDLSFPRWEEVRWDVPARGNLPAVRFYWHNGSRAPGMRDDIERLLGRGLDWGDKGKKEWADWAGCLIVGAEGKIHTTAHNATFTMLPEEKFRSIQQQHPESLETSRGHLRDWLAACRGASSPWAHFGYAGPLTEFNLLGNVATQFAGPLEYDPVAGKIVNHAEADAMLNLKYRDGWSL